MSQHYNEVFERVYKTSIREALDVYKASPSAIQHAKQTDSPVLAWHGTNVFWTLWFCLYGIDGTVPPPTKTLGRGNSIDGYSLIKDGGLYVSARETSGFLYHICLEVKPSELKVSMEMNGLGYTDPLMCLKLGDCIIPEKLPAKRIVKVFAYDHSTSTTKEYSRSQFISLFPDPIKYLKSLSNSNMYHFEDNILLQKASLNFIFNELKEELKDGTPIEDIINIIEAGIKYNDYKRSWGISEAEALKLLDWAKKQKNM